MPQPFGDFSVASYALVFGELLIFPYARYIWQTWYIRRYMYVYIFAYILFPLTLLGILLGSGFD